MGGIGISRCSSSFFRMCAPPQIYRSSHLTPILVDSRFAAQNVIQDPLRIALDWHTERDLTADSLFPHRHPTHRTCFHSNFSTNVIPNPTLNLPHPSIEMILNLTEHHPQPPEPYPVLDTLINFWQQVHPKTNSEDFGHLTPRSILTEYFQEYQSD